LDEVDKQVDAMPNVIFIATSALLNDELRVVENESAHDDKAKIQVDLEDEPGSKEYVEQGQHHECGQTGEQGASQI